MSQELAVTTVHADRGDPILRFISPMAPIRTILKHRELLGQLARREVVGRYRGSYLGVLWALLTPLMTLAVFSLVFGTIHNNKWAKPAHIDQQQHRQVASDGASIKPPAPSPLEFPMNMFIGIIMFGIFSEVATRAAVLITSNPNFVKKAVFPLELLGVSVAIGSVVHALMTLAIELVFVWIVQGHVPMTALLLPVVFIPAFLLTLGACWALAAMGVFFRDLGQAVGPVVQLMFFLTPIVYSMRAFENTPTAGWLLRMFNPFVTIVENARRLLIDGEMPDWSALAIVTVVSGVVAMIGYIIFMKVRRYFADAM